MHPLSLRSWALPQRSPLQRRLKPGSHFCLNLGSSVNTQFATMQFTADRPVVWLSLGELAYNAFTAKRPYDPITRYEGTVGPAAFQIALRSAMLVCLHPGDPEDTTEREVGVVVRELWTY